jgi:methylenetetrahydrofolate dehydrogenase (NADP+)/methenyltetrahydrofolate cyclohydrolase
MTKLADFLFVAVGKPEIIGAEHVKPGAVVIDIGIGKNASGRLVGDVKYDEVSKTASALSPVPGGVGPMTILGLLENTLESAKRKV